MGPQNDGLAVGIASHVILSGAQAEIAILVDDAWQGDGIGTLLIEHLAAVARRAGIQELVGDVLASNVTMLRTTASLAPGIGRHHGDDPAWFAYPSQPSLTNERLPQSALATALPNTIRCGPC
jgi:GNAT superfamily N-acetyltransferase